MIKVKLAPPPPGKEVKELSAPKSSSLLINLSSAILERRGSGSPFIIEAETGLILSQCLPVQHAPIANTTGAIATPLLLCNYSKERGKGKKIERKKSVDI